MKLSNTFTLTGLALTLPLAAFAAVNVGDTLGTTDDEIRAQLEAQGYTIEEIEREGDEIEVEVTLDGQMLEIELSAAGEVLEIELEDDEDGDDD